MPKHGNRQKLGGSKALAFVKTKLCKFNKAGVCTRGEECTFAHGGEQLHTVPDFSFTRLCRDFVKAGACKAGADCKFAHGVEELRPCPVPDGDETENPADIAAATASFNAAILAPGPGPGISAGVPGVMNAGMNPLQAQVLDPFQPTPFCNYSPDQVAMVAQSSLLQADSAAAENLANYQQLFEQLTALQAAKEQLTMMQLQQAQQQQQLQQQMQQQQLPTSAPSSRQPKRVQLSQQTPMPAAIQPQVLMASPPMAVGQLPAPMGAEGRYGMPGVPPGAPPGFPNASVQPTTRNNMKNAAKGKHAKSPAAAMSMSMQPMSMQPAYMSVGSDKYRQEVDPAASGAVPSLLPMMQPPSMQPPARGRHTAQLGKTSLNLNTLPEVAPIDFQEDLRLADESFSRQSTESEDLTLEAFSRQNTYDKQQEYYCDSPFAVDLDHTEVNEKVQDDESMFSMDQTTASENADTFRRGHLADGGEESDRSERSLETRQSPGSASRSNGQASTTGSRGGASSSSQQSAKAVTAKEREIQSLLKMLATKEKELAKLKVHNPGSTGSSSPSERACDERQQQDAMAL